MKSKLIIALVIFGAVLSGLEPLAAQSPTPPPLAGSWWVGDMVAGGHLLPYDKFYDDPRFPKWNIDDVLPGPRSREEADRE